MYFVVFGVIAEAFVHTYVLSCLVFLCGISFTRVNQIRSTWYLLSNISGFRKISVLEKEGTKII